MQSIKDGCITPEKMPNAPLFNLAKESAAVIGRKMKVYILVWLNDGYFTIKLASGREVILAFNDGEKAAAFATRVLHKLGDERMLVTFELPVEGENVKQVLRKMVPIPSELEHIELIYPSDPLFSLIIDEMLGD